MFHFAISKNFTLTFCQLFLNFRFLLLIFALEKATSGKQQHKHKHIY